MMGVRFAIALVVLGVVSAQEKPSIGIDWSFANAVYGKIMGLLGLGQIHVFENPNDSERVNAYGENRHDHGWHHDEDHHHHHHGHHGGHHEDWHKKMHMKMKEAHACHEKCGSDAACHTKCPKPWAPLVKACQDFPAIQKCHSTCKGEACDKCPKFEVEWMNKKFAKNPEKAAKMAEQKCPMMLKAHACHQACSPEDMECHHKCHGENHHHGGWHHHGDHHDDDHHKHGHHHGDDHGDDHHHKHHGHDDDHHENHHQHWKKMKKVMKKAMMCHATCGKDAECHKKCPKPFAVFVKACEDFPAIQKCRTECKDAECTDKCPKFEKEWMNKKMAKFPERVMKMGEKKCPMVLKAHACHQACTPGDFQCHHKCPHMFPFQHGKWGGHHDKEEFLQQRPQQEEMQETQPILI